MKKLTKKEKEKLAKEIAEDYMDLIDTRLKRDVAEFLQERPVDERTSDN